MPEHCLNFRKQPGKLNRLRLVLVASGVERSLPIADHGVRRERDHRNPSRGRIGFETPGRFPPVDLGKAHVHQDQIGRLVRAAEIP